MDDPKFLAEKYCDNVCQVIGSIAFSIKRQDSDGDRERHRDQGGRTGRIFDY
jgi:hypothetical protein